MKRTKGRKKKKNGAEEFKFPSHRNQSTLVESQMCVRVRLFFFSWIQYAVKLQLI